MSHEVVEKMEYLQYNFTAAEMKQIAGELARANQSKDETERRKKQVVSDIGAQIEALNATIASESRKYNNGYDFRDIPCRVEYDVPKKGYKRIWRVDTGEIVKEVPMSQDELQRKLKFDEEQQKAEYVAQAQPAETAVLHEQTPEPDANHSLLSAADYIDPRQATNPPHQVDSDEQPWVPDETEITAPEHEAPEVVEVNVWAPVLEVDQESNKQSLTYKGKTVPFPSKEADALMAQARKDSKKK